MPTAREVLASRRAWSSAQVDALFAEHGDDAVKVVAEIVEPLDLVGQPLAYKTIFHVLQYLLDHPTIDIEPIAPLLRRFVAYEPYDPDGKRQFALVRTHALRLLARRRDPAARDCIARWRAVFPVERDSDYGASLAEVMSEVASHLDH